MSDRGAPFSVVIPAHNEEAVIGRCLDAILADAPSNGRPEIVVVCNGCGDETAERARRYEGVTVIELATGSKPLALNAGNRAVKATPRFFVDADVVVSFHALAAAAAELAKPGVKTAAPRRKLVTDGCAWPVRSYYRVWRSLPFAKAGTGGCGVYGLSTEGLAEIGEFPSVISDDGFVRSRFASAARRSVVADVQGRAAEVKVFAPRTTSDLISIEARRRDGDAELRSRFPSSEPDGSTTLDSLARVVREAGLFDVAVYLAIKAAGRLQSRWRRLRGRSGAWLRDESSRVDPVR